LIGRIFSEKSFYFKEDEKWIHVFLQRMKNGFMKMVLLDSSTDDLTARVI
jgi:hypothetical protein